MKTKIYSLLVWLASLQFISAQVPEKMSYQAVMRNATGQLIANQSIAVKVSVLQGSASGAVVYSERLTGSTNPNGLISLEIGTGTVLSGTFATINWSTGTYFLKTETDPSGGSSYTITGNSQLLSVHTQCMLKTRVEESPVLTIRFLNLLLRTL